jgi:CRP-like cAMP-binding protein
VDPQLLRSSHLFATLSDAQLEAAVFSGRSLTLDNGQMLFETGDRAERFYFVESGKIKLYRLSPDGVEKVIEIVQPGHTFAEALMFLNQPVYPVSAAALHGARVFSIDSRNFKEVLRGSVGSCFKIMGTMSQRLRGLIKEIDHLTLQTASTRLCGMLWRQMESSGSETVDLNIPKGVLASRLSIKPETFSRILHNLSDQGLLEVKGSKIRVLQADALRELAQPESIVGLVDLPVLEQPSPAS